MIGKLIDICGADYVKSAREDMLRYGSDETEDLCYPPEYVVLPENTAQISEILKYCYQHDIPVTPRGAGTGLAGGALPVKGGLVLSTERLNKIIDIDTRNLQATVEPGVINEALQQAVKEQGLYYPPDPASKGSSFIGGNVSTNAGGPHAVKYGVTAAYVLNLEVVLPNGDIIYTGANTLKNSTGYNLTQLFVGSEGTLGVITKIVLRLIPVPRHRVVMLTHFPDAISACGAVSAVFHAGITPSALEFMERSAVEKSIAYMGGSPFVLYDDTNAMLLTEVDGNHIAELMDDCEKIAAIYESFGCGETLLADNASQQEDIWKLRRCTGLAVKKGSIYKEEDTVVPRAELPKLLTAVKEIGNRYGFESVCYGHAGDGNLHVNILKGNLSEQFWKEELPTAIREIFIVVKQLNGTISGEHGIGWVQKQYMDIVFNQTQLELFRNIKNCFDPKGLMNPSKITP